VNWKRVLHHRYLGVIVGCGSIGWLAVQMGRHGQTAYPLIAAILGFGWALDDVLYEDYGWKVPGYWIEQLLQKIPLYVKIKAWIEKTIGGNDVSDTESPDG